MIDESQLSYLMIGEINTLIMIKNKKSLMQISVEDCSGQLRILSQNTDNN